MKKVIMRVNFIDGKKRLFFSVKVKSFGLDDMNSAAERAMSAMSRPFTAGVNEVRLSVETD